MTDVLERASSEDPIDTAAPDAVANPIPERDAVLDSAPDSALDPAPGRLAQRVARGLRPDVEGLRAIAIIFIVASYFATGTQIGAVGSARTAGAVGIAAPLGATGIDVALVVAGFLVTRQLLAAGAARTGGSTVRLAQLRVRWAAAVTHGVVALAIVTAAVVVAAQLWMTPGQARSSAIAAIASVAGVLNLQRGPASLNPDPLQQLWAVSLAAQLIVAIAALSALFVFSGRAGTWVRLRQPLLAVALIAVIAVSLYWWIEASARSAPATLHSPAPRAWEVALGGLVAVAASPLAQLPRFVAQLTAAAGLGLVVAGGFGAMGAAGAAGAVGAVGAVSAVGTYSAAVPAVAAALVIAAGSGAPTRIERLLGESLVLCIGRLSYCWYLWQWPLLILGPIVIGHPLIWQQRLVVAWLSLVASVVTYQLAGNPDRPLRRSPVRYLGISALVTVLVIGLGVAAAASTNGSCPC